VPEPRVPIASLDVTAGAGDNSATDLPEASPGPTRLMRYGVAVGIVALAFLLRFAIFGHLDNRLPFAFFLSAVMFAAWYGGLGPGLLAAVSGLLLGDYFFLPRHVSLGPLGEAERTLITVYALTATLVALLMEDLHARIRRLKSKLRKLQTAAGSAEKR
jgi:two-component system sensor histidine kinase/response regulator